MFSRSWQYLKKADKGFTLIELLVVIAIMAFLTGAIAMTFNLVTNVSANSTEQYMVMSQVQVAGSTIAKDIASSCNVTAGSAGNWHCSMSRYMWNGTDNVTTTPVDYIISNGVLTRRVNGTGGTRIAEYISGPGTDTTFVSASENNTYLLTIKAKYEDTSFSSMYKVVCKSP
jgi:prepilin-type N-terminal cleavage/methylation domain-containing protein